MIEIYKDIINFEGIYQISNKGNLKSFKVDPKGRVLSNVNKKGGYLSVVLTSKEKKTKYIRIHRLVAKYFIANPLNKPQVNHKDGNKQNNRVDNLEWVTPRENVLHSIKSNPDQLKGILKHNQVTKLKDIQQLSLEGELIDTFKGAKRASEATGVCQRNISQVANKEEYKPGLTRKQAGGFIWRVKEEVN